jgi:hypothetical protein
MSIGLIGAFLLFFEIAANIHKFRIYADKCFFHRNHYMKRFCNFSRYLQKKILFLRRNYEEEIQP